jgi:hypothetical protein
MSEYNTILYDRLLFELKVLCQNVENMINTNEHISRITNTHIDKIQNDFYTIISNLSN